MDEKVVSGHITFQPEQGNADGGMYIVRNPITGHGVQIVTRNVSPDDLRALADHLEAQRAANQVADVGSDPKGGRGKTMLDLRACYQKLADQQPITDNEVLDLLKELEHFRGSLAYLATCQAATLESLPKSFSKSGRGRHVELCKTAAAMLGGDASRVRYPVNLDAARDRCMRAAENHETA